MSTTTRSAARPKTKPALKKLPAEMRNISAVHNEIVAKARLVSVGLLNTEAVFHPERMPSNGDDMRIVTATPRFRAGVSDDGLVLQAGVRLAVSVLPLDEKVDSAVLEVKAEYVVTYELPTGSNYPADAVAFFAGRTGVFNAWPFFRELAHSTVARMGLPPLMIPLLTLPPLPKVGH